MVSNRRPLACEARDQLPFSLLIGLELGSLEVLNGSLPPRALRLIREWARMHPDELAENWVLAQALEPLVPIDPLA
ncbi:MAG: DUF4160 domain-containing protein [Solirubrobacteraceae bacterium]